MQGKNKWTPGTLWHSQISPGKSFYTSNCGLCATMFFPKEFPLFPPHVDKLSIRWNHQMVQSHLIDGQKGLPEDGQKELPEVDKIEN